MNKIIHLYLDRVLAQAELPPERAAEVRAELEDHLRSSYETRIERGQTEEEAAWAAIREMGHPVRVGRRIARPFSWIDIRSNGTAKGVIAIGPRAVGVFAFGGIAVGGVAVGGISVGVISLGGLGLGILAWAGLSLGVFACGGLSVGLLAAGGLAVGAVAAGSEAYGLTVLGMGRHAIAHAYYAADQVPAWLEALKPWMAVPKFILRYAGWILLLQNLIVVACVVALMVHGARQRRESEQDWLFE